MTAARAHFEALYAGAADPWGVASTWYERRKAAILLAMLPRERYALAFEPACGVGALSRELASRCDRLLAVDFSRHAVETTRVRLAGFSGVETRVADLTREWPDERFELIVLSEFAYYLDSAALAAMLATLQAARGSADIACCHYLGDFDDRATSPVALAQAFVEALGAPDARYADALFEVQIWAARGAMPLPGAPA